MTTQKREILVHQNFQQVLLIGTYVFKLMQLETMELIFSLFHCSHVHFFCSP
jgi:hypothetical protein